MAPIGWNSGMTLLRRAAARGGERGAGTAQLWPEAGNVLDYAGRLGEDRDCLHHSTSPVTPAPLSVTKGGLSCLDLAYIAPPVMHRTRCPKTGPHSSLKAAAMA
jgi:hypothetical protein